MYKKLVIIIGVVILGWGMYVLTRSEAEVVQEPVVEAPVADVATEPAETVVTPSQEATNQEVHTVTYTVDGFSPQELTIKVGDRVVWINNTTADMWPATGMHPTHTVYPGSDIKKCTEADTSMIFDACRPFASGDAYAFTFTEVGTWRYHDHLKVSNTGTIIVTE
ncbi:hypothetical protein A3C87_03455 [Candidatus Kaiserbacteria bacterium RIFCSPHIGHO2_02_FULL_49_34]|uniref:EfeO-type cupredoxin-like domain-containing protein n=1 Tax=Candidatus Kaiserbacteria bacterium RIFCSPHIGHO2_02_FULL_49_34 TaxID=1798491 RepID=A0A1F6DI99_9BACT|nr:MAG: hypothetical protein A3C87_03455 [Candidatus Kaiserbacteria bacterium RIFCSPHIGHO2_02_FULL_49_34]